MMGDPEEKTVSLDEELLSSNDYLLEEDIVDENLSTPKTMQPVDEIPAENAENMESNMTIL